MGNLKNVDKFQLEIDEIKEIFKDKKFSKDKNYLIEISNLVAPILAKYFSKNAEIELGMFDIIPKKINTNILIQVKSISKKTLVNMLLTQRDCGNNEFFIDEILIS